MMKEYVERIEGSFIEEKESYIRWVYRHTEYSFGSSQAKELLSQLVSLFKGNHDIYLYFCKDYIEVSLSGYNKGTLLTILAQKYCPDFILCIGNDYKDEEVYAAMKNTKCSFKYAITIGQRSTLATHYMETNEEASQMITSLSLINK